MPETAPRLSYKKKNVHVSKGAVQRHHGRKKGIEKCASAGKTTALAPRGVKIPLPPCPDGGGDAGGGGRSFGGAVQTGHKRTRNSVSFSISLSLSPPPSVFSWILYVIGYEVP